METAFIEKVNHPAHYNNSYKYECIDVMKENFGTEAIKDFCLLNSFKYLYRCKYKENEFDDIKKAIWYLEKYLEFGERKSEKE